MSRLIDRREIKRVRLSGSYAITIATGENEQGLPLGELLVETPAGARPLHAPIGALVVLADAIRAAVADLDARKAAKSPTAPSGADAEQCEPGHLDDVTSGGRAIVLRRAVTRDQKTAIVLAIDDARRGRLGEITLLRSGARRLARLMQHHGAWVFPEGGESAATVSEFAAAEEPTVPVDGEVLVAPRAEPRPPAELAPEPVKSRYSEALPQPRRRIAP